MFSFESKFYRIACTIYKIVGTNLLFIMTSLLVVTIPASLSATVAVLKHTGTISIFKEYFIVLKKSLIKTIPLGVFNCFSILLIFQLTYGLMAKNLLVKLLILLVTLFVIVYNLNLYIYFDLKNNENLFIQFRNTFFIQL